MAPFATYLKVGITACIFAAAIALDASGLATKALKLAQSGKLQDALPLFEQAARASPMDPNLWNNVGVTHLRLGNLKAAESSFRRALALDPDHPDAIDNMKETRKYLEKEAVDSRSEGVVDADSDAVDHVQMGISLGKPLFPGVDLSKIRHKVRQLPRVSIRDIHLPENKDYAEGRKPFVLTDSVDTQKILQSLNPSLFMSPNGKFAAVTTDFYPTNMQDKNVKPYLLPFWEAATEAIRPSSRFPMGAAGGARYLHWNMKRQHWNAFQDMIGPVQLPLFMNTTDAWLEYALPNEEFRSEFQITSHWRMLLLGTRGAGMFNHVDTLRTASYQLQLRGAKTWHLCAPSQSRFLSPDNNMFAPNYKRFPESLHADCFLDTAHAGEAIFYPADYWHQTWNEPPEDGDFAIGITDTIVDANNYLLVEPQLQENCRKPKLPNINPSEALCKHFARIYQWWRAAFEKSRDFVMHSGTRTAAKADMWNQRFEWNPCEQCDPL